MEADASIKRDCSSPKPSASRKRGSSKGGKSEKKVSIASSANALAEIPLKVNFHYLARLQENLGDTKKMQAFCRQWSLQTDAIIPADMPNIIPLLSQGDDNYLPKLLGPELDFRKQEIHLELSKRIIHQWLCERDDNKLDLLTPEKLSSDEILRADLTHRLSVCWTHYLVELICSKGDGKWLHPDFKAVNTVWSHMYLPLGGVSYNGGEYPRYCSVGSSRNSRSAGGAVITTDSNKQKNVPYHNFKISMDIMGEALSFVVEFSFDHKVKSLQVLSKNHSRVILQHTLYSHDDPNAAVVSQEYLMRALRKDVLIAEDLPSGVIEPYDLFRSVSAKAFELKPNFKGHDAEFDIRLVLAIISWATLNFKIAFRHTVVSMLADFLKREHIVIAVCTQQKFRIAKLLLTLFALSKVEFPSVLQSGDDTSFSSNSQTGAIKLHELCDDLDRSMCFKVFAPLHPFESNFEGRVNTNDMGEEQRWAAYKNELIQRSSSSNVAMTILAALQENEFENDKAGMQQVSKAGIKRVCKTFIQNLIDAGNFGLLRSIADARLQPPGYTMLRWDESIQQAENKARIAKTKSLLAPHSSLFDLPLSPCQKYSRSVTEAEKEVTRYIVVTHNAGPPSRSELMQHSALLWRLNTIASSSSGDGYDPSGRGSAPPRLGYCPSKFGSSSPRSSGSSSPRSPGSSSTRSPRASDHGANPTPPQSPCRSSQRKLHGSPVRIAKCIHKTRGGQASAAFGASSQPGSPSRTFSSSSRPSSPGSGF